MTYAVKFREKNTQRMLQVRSVSALSAQTAASTTTLYKWRSRGLNGGMTTPPSPNQRSKHRGTRTPIEKMRMIVEFEDLTPEETGGWLRSHGVHRADLEALSPVSDNDRMLREWALDLYRRGEFTDAANMVFLARADDQFASIEWRIANVKTAPIPRSPEERLERFKAGARMLKAEKLLNAKYVLRWYRALGEQTTSWLKEQGMEMDVHLPYELR